MKRLDDVGSLPAITFEGSRQPTSPRVSSPSLTPTSSTWPAPTAIRTRAIPFKTTSYVAGGRDHGLRAGKPGVSVSPPTERLHRETS